MDREGFTGVYEQSLQPIWCFVRSRVPDPQEAQDITGEVFARAWEAWPSFDPSRGSVTAWLCGIAKRTMADWWRRRQKDALGSKLRIQETDILDEMLHVDDGKGPLDRIIIEQELLTSLRSALLALDDREREALALRFAAGLRIKDVGHVLGLSEGATKMMIYRTLMKLRGSLAAESSSLMAEEQAADILDSAVDGVLARQEPTIPDPLLERLVHFMVAVHQPAVPPDLPDRVAACIECSAEVANERLPAERREATSIIRSVLAGRGRSPSWLSIRKKGAQTMRIRPLLTRLGLATAPALTGPACLVCAGGAAVWGTITSLGLMPLGFVLHYGLWVLAPLNLLPLWRSFRRHRNPWGLRLAALGVLLILVPLLVHEPFEFDVELHNLIWVGMPLLAAGGLMDWRARRRPLAVSTA